MTALDRRRFLGAATALGATAAWSSGRAAPSKLRWTERRDLFPEGVASGDPQADSVILWTRRPPGSSEQTPVNLVVEVAEDETFQRVVASAPATPSAENGWTVRVLVGGLKPSREYWYRFVDANGAGSRIGRTLTAPAPEDPREVRFAFVSCQDANAGAMNAWRRMLFEDQQATPDRRLDFVCHLGDFIYEIVWYPEDRPQGRYDRKIRDVARYPNGVKFQDMHYPTTLEDYRAVWLGYLKDPDLQDARAWFPFVNMGDNHEFSWRGYQSIQKFGDQVIWGQTRRVAANQAWFEHQPARVIHKGALNRFDAPDVTNTPVTAFDDQGLGQEPNNLAAIGSLTAYRALRFGKNVELFLTDQHAYRTEDPNDRPETNPLGPALAGFPEFQPQELTEMLDAGRTYAGGRPPAEIRFGDKAIPNFRKDQAPVTMLGATQKAWFLKTLKASKATWKIWGATNATLEMRCDYQNLPAGLTTPWPGAGYADGGGGDWSGCYAERSELYDFVRDNAITGFSAISGDRHSFWAGYAAKALPPKAFEPVGLAFVTGSISAAGMAEALEHTFPKAHPLRALFLADRPNAKPEHTMNMTMRHGVRSALEYTASRDVMKARALSNPGLSPHLKFVDMAGHGYAVVRAGPGALETEFVAIERPIERNPAPNGGPLEYRVVHRAALWKAGERPHLEQQVLEGDPKLSI